jgi:hypothetical protein
MKGKHKSGNQYRSLNNENQAQKPASNEFSQQDQEYVQAHEKEVKWQTQKIKSAKIDG